MALFEMETGNRTILNQFNIFWNTLYLKQYHKTSVLVLFHYSDGNNSDRIVI